MMFVELLRQFMRTGTLLRAIIAEQKRQAAVLDQILSALTLPYAECLHLTGDVEGTITNGAEKMRLSESQQGTLTLTATKKNGQPATVDGVPSWTVQPGMESAIALTVAPDGMSAAVKGVPFASGEPNVKSLSILVQADADLGEGVRLLQASASLELIRDEAEVLSLSEGPVTDQ